MKASTEIECSQTDAMPNKAGEVVDLSEAFAREQVENNSEVASRDTEGPMLINDAEVLGAEYQGLGDFLQQSVVFMTGELWDQGDRRNTPAGKWKRNEMPWGVLLTHDDSPLTNHVENGHKQGAAIVLGETIDGNRNAESVKSLYAVVIDIDSGPKVDDVIEKLQAKGLFALVYTSFNHNKTEVVLKHDDVVRKLKLDGTPNRTQVIEYLRAHHNDRYDEDFLEGVEIVDARSHGPKGLQIILETPPLHKFRIVLPLEQPVQLADLGTTANQWKDAWADLVTGFVVNELDVSFDSTSCDVNRLFYTPRHPKGGEWDCVLIQGKPLNVDDIEPYSKNAYVKNRDTSDPFAYGLEDDDKPPICMTPKGKSLNAYHAKFKDRLLLPDLILAETPDKVRREVSDGKIEIECPFEHDHSTEGGTGTVCMSPEVNENGYWTVSCPHDACQGRHKLEFLEEMLKAGWFEEELLRDRQYLLGAEDDEEAGVSVTGEYSTSEVDKLISEAGIDKDTSDEDLMVFLRAHKGADRSSQKRFSEALGSTSRSNGATIFKPSDIEKMWKQIAKEARKENAQREDADALNIGEGFTPMVEQTRERLVEANEPPFLFNYFDKPTVLRPSADGKLRAKQLSVDGLSQVISRHIEFIDWQGPSGDKYEVSVPPPLDVVKNLFHSDITEFCVPLRGFVDTPFFDEQGDLVVEPGYHEGAQVFYEPHEDLVVPMVSPNPTEQERKDALEKILDVVCDFPLGGQAPEDILTGEVPAATNLVGMIILFFMREMINGPTPGHLFNKPGPGTGASLLNDVVSIICTGEDAKAVALPRSDEEMSKTLTAELRKMPRAINFDNISTDMDSAELAMAMTQRRYGARVLQTSETIDVEVSCVFTFTANFIEMSEELLRRMTLIDLDAGVAEPHARSGPKGGGEWRHADIKEHVRKNRGELVWAALTLIQAWVAGGAERQTDATLASYEDWAQSVGGVLHHGGLKGFLGNRDRLAATRNDADDALRIFCDMLAEFSDGQKFRAGSETGGAISVLELLNSGCEATDERPLLISGWGYNQEDQRYNSSARIGQKLKQFSQKPHMATDSDRQEIEILLEATEDKKTRSIYYTLRKSKKER